MWLSLFSSSAGASAGRGIASSFFDTGKAAAPAATAAPVFQPSTPYAPPAPPDAPFYQQGWFAPVAVVAGLGVVAFFLLPKRA